MGALYRFDPFHLLCLALLCVLFYQPLLSDLCLANLGCFQLIGLTAFPGALDPAVHHADDPKPRARSATAPSARRRKR